MPIIDDFFIFNVLHIFSPLLLQHVSGDHLQDLNLPPGTRGHFTDPGSDGPGASRPPVGAAINLLQDFGIIGGDNDFKSGDSFNSVGDFKPGVNFDDFDLKPLEETKFGFDDSPFNADFIKHEVGVVPHEGGHQNDIQYGIPHGGGKKPEFSTGYSDFAIGDFGPVKDTSLIKDSPHDDIISTSVSFGKPHTVGHEYGAAPVEHEYHGPVHDTSFRPIAPGPAFGKPVHGAIPYGPPKPIRRPPIHPYGFPPKPIMNHAVVIPIEPHRRPHRGRGKGGKGGYFKKFMGMLGY